MIGNNVLTGMKVSVLSYVTVDDGAVIGASDGFVARYLLGSDEKIVGFRDVYVHAMGYTLGYGSNYEIV